MVLVRQECGYSSHLMMKQIIFAVLVSSVLFSTTSHSAELSYSYVEAGYITRLGQQEAIGPGGDIDYSTDGFSIRGAFTISDSFYITGNYFSEKSELYGMHAQIDSLDIGAGYHYALSSKVDIFTDISFSQQYLSNDFGNYDFDGFRFRLGLRGQLAQNLEGSLSINRRELNNDLGASQINAYVVGGVWNFSDNFSLAGDAEFADDDRYFLGLRYNY